LAASPEIPIPDAFIILKVHGAGTAPPPSSAPSLTGACIGGLFQLAKAAERPISGEQTTLSTDRRSANMKPLVHPADEPKIAAAFAAVVNMTADQIETWLVTDESRSVGQIRRGESESIGRQSARRIIDILATPADCRTEADYAHMRKVVGYVRRHLAQRPARDVTHTRWRYSLMNWGHDPLRR
jgi:hypothetical protein